MKKTHNLLALCLIGLTISLTSCFSHYPIQKKSPCGDTTREEKIVMIGDAIMSEFKPDNLVLKNDGVSYLKFDFKFEDIRYVRAKQKKKKYWIQIREFNGEMNVIYLKDHSLMERANNALMCLSNTQPTNGRPIKGLPVPIPSKPSNTNERIESRPSTPSSFDKLIKLEEMLEEGLITKKDYKKKKKELLKE